MFAAHPFVFGYRIRRTIEAPAGNVSAAIEVAHRATSSLAMRDRRPAEADAPATDIGHAYTRGLLIK